MARSNNRGEIYSGFRTLSHDDLFKVVLGYTQGSVMLSHGCANPGSRTVVTVALKFGHTCFRGCFCVTIRHGLGLYLSLF